MRNKPPEENCNLEKEREREEAPSPGQARYRTSDFRRNSFVSRREETSNADVSLENFFALPRKRYENVFTPIDSRRAELEMVEIEESGNK